VKANLSSLAAFMHPVDKTRPICLTPPIYQLGEIIVSCFLIKKLWKMQSILHTCVCKILFIDSMKISLSLYPASRERAKRCLLNILCATLPPYAVPRQKRKLRNEFLRPTLSWRSDRVLLGFYCWFLFCRSIQGSLSLVLASRPVNAVIYGCEMLFFYIQSMT